MAGNADIPRRPKRNQFVTKSGKTIKVNRTLGERMRSYKDSKAIHKAELLHMLPKGRIKRAFARLNPQYQYKYWFSREGAIMALKVIGIGAIAGFMLLLGVFAYYRKDLPNLKDISGTNIGGTTFYYDRTGQTLLWQDSESSKRIPVKNTEISDYLKHATIAVEDKDFYKHGGFDVRGILRAGVNDVTGGSTQGGSTITQQLVKVTQNWTNERTITRKMKEVILAVELERSYTKDEILTGYLNAAPYGGIDYGAEASARDYFHKSAKDLTLDEAAMLAAIPKAPDSFSYYSPNFEKDTLVSRQHYILDLMQQQGYITTQQRDDAKKIDTIATIQPRTGKYDGIKAPYFVLAARSQLEEKYGSQTIQRGGWKVITTLDMNLQNNAESEISKGLAQVKRQGGDEAAFAAEDIQTGQMVALVGGVDFFDKDHGQNNYAQWPLPPGSSFKPYDYTALIENSTNAGAGSVLYDSQGKIPGYDCTDKNPPERDPNANCLWDFNREYPGPITLRYAIGGSRNVPAVKTMAITGVDKTIETAEKMGLKSGYKCYPYSSDPQKEGPCGTSSAIGDGAYLHLDEHVNGIATIGRNGAYIPQTYILKITDAAGKTVDEFKQPKSEQVVRADSAYIVGDMMADTNATYFSANKPQRYTNSQGTWKFGVKTGTTNEAKDGWMTGFSSKYAAAVWVGYHTRTRAMTGAMENMTQPIWQGWMKDAHKDLKPVDVTRPSDIQELPAFVITKHVGYGSVEPSRSTDLYPSWYKPPSKAGGVKTIDTVSNKLATACTPERAKKTLGGADANIFSIDPFVTQGQAVASDNAPDDVHNCSDEKPSVTLTAPPSCDSSCTFTATVTEGTHPLSSDQFPGTVNIMIDNQIVQSFSVSISPSTISYNYTVTSAGSHTVSAQVIDSVLYDSTDSAVVNFTLPVAPVTPAANPIHITNPSNGDNVNAGPLNVTWTGGSGTYTVYLNGVPKFTTTTKNAIIVVTSSGGVIKVSDDQGDASDSVTVH